MVASQLILRDQKWLTLTRSIAALLSALFAGIRLKVIVDWAEVVAVDGVAEGVFEVLEVDDAAVVELEASGTPEVADRMRYIRALAVNLSRTSKEKWKNCRFKLKWLSHFPPKFEKMKKYLKQCLKAAKCHTKRQKMRLNSFNEIDEEFGNKIFLLRST